jgi:hypothetical protein
MPELPQALSPAALNALLQKVDEVCAQAKALRNEIVKAMDRHRADDRNVSSQGGAPRPTRTRKRARS